MKRRATRDNPTTAAVLRLGRHRRRGSQIVELAIVLPVLMLFILGIVEFATLGYDKMSLVQGARSGARDASIGSTVAVIRSRTRLAATGQTLTDAQIVPEYNLLDAGTGTWAAITDNGTVNSVPYGRLVRVRIVNWPHQLITGTFFSWLPGVTGSQLPLSAQMVMRRE